jgi:PAS domain S-box-containing protein
MDLQEAPVSKQAPQFFTHRLGLLIGTAIVATAGFTLAAYDTVTTVQIHGPLYAQILQSKDLIVDAFPPPLYIVDSYLVTLELLGAAPLERDTLVRRFKQFEQEFHAKQAEWRGRLPPGPLRDNLTESSGKWAREFYKLWNREFLPAVGLGDIRTMTDLFYGPLTSHFEQHRREILELIQLADTQSRQVEGEARSVLRDRTYLLGVLGLGLLCTIFLVGWLINRQVSAPLIRSLRDSEERTRSIVNSALEAIVVMDDHGRITEWNPQAEQILGWTRREVIGRKLSDTIIPLQYREAHNRGLQHYLATGEGPALRKRLELTALRSAGTEFPIELAITPLKLTSGTTFSGFIRDISERKQVEIELRQAKESAEAATIAKSQFLANMSHEIRTPMNGVLGLSELLLATQLNEKQRHLAQSVHRSGTALLEIINDILDFSKIEAGKLKLERIEFGIRQTVEEAVDLFAEPAGRKGLELVCFVPHQIPDAVVGDPIRLRQILLNLVGNAVKFTEKGEVALKMHQVSAQDGTLTLRFEVSDTGIGLASDTQDRLFQAFSQADATTIRRFGGTGLGLAIVKQLAQLMGGEVGVESTPGHGSKFWFTIQLGLAEERTNPLSERNLAGCRILIVDDNATNRYILESHVTSWGAQATVVDSAAEALNALRIDFHENARIDFAILDIQMPEMDGFMLAQAIKADPRLKEIPLIALSSIDPADDDSRQKTSFQMWLQKPVRQSQLYDCLVRLWQPSSHHVKPNLPQHMVHASLSGRILLVEDNPVNQEVARGMLELLGYTVSLAENGRKAVDAATTQTFDLILMDCQMPEMDGFTATRVIRDRERETEKPHLVPIIALTANAMDGDRQRCLASGMNDYLTKPFTVDQLQALLPQWAASKSLKPSDCFGPPSGLFTGEPDSVISARTATHSPLDKHAWQAILDLQRPGRPDILASVLAQYLEDSRALVDQIRRAVESGNPKALYEAAHRLKSSSTQLGAKAIAARCAELETLGREARLDSATNLVEQLGCFHRSASEAIESELRVRTRR